MFARRAVRVFGKGPALAIGLQLQLPQALVVIARAKRMPPKKKEVDTAPSLLGRFGTSLRCGIVGLPNVG